MHWDASLADDIIEMFCKQYCSNDLNALAPSKKRSRFYFLEFYPLIGQTINLIKDNSISILLICT